MSHDFYIHGLKLELIYIQLDISLDQVFTSIFL